MAKQIHADKVLLIMLIIAILGAVGMVGYTIAMPKSGERFTEFYILGLSGKAEDYPRQIRLGEEGRVIVGIVNHEHEVVSYRIQVRIDGAKNKELGPIVLEHDEKWEEAVSFTPDRVEETQKVEFLLYKNGESEPYLKPLCLWVSVKEQ